MKKDKNTFIWRLVSLTLCLLLLCSFFVRYFILNTDKRPDIIIFGIPGLYIPLITITVLAALLVIFPYRFYIHAAACWILSLAFLLGDGRANALMMHFIGYLFLYRQGFFATKARIKLICGGGLLLLVVILAQQRFEPSDFVHNIPRYMDFLIALAVSYLILRPEINYLKNRKKDMVLQLPADYFTERDVLILEKIIQGEKYEAIAQETKMSMSSLKRHIRRLFLRLQVSDRLCFITFYANHKVILDK